MKKILTALTLAAAIAPTGNTTYAQDLTLPYTFSSHTRASAGEVNANFQAIVDKVNAQQRLIEQLQQQLTVTQSSSEQTNHDSADSINIPTTNEYWAGFEHHLEENIDIEETDDGIRMNAVSPRLGGSLITNNSYNLVDKDVYVKWKANGGGSYAQFGVYTMSGLEHTATSTGGYGGFSTGHSWSSSTVIASDVWYFTRYRINADKTYTANTCSEYHCDNNGVETRNSSGTIPDEINMEALKIRVRISDPYAGSPVHVVVGEVIIQPIESQ